MAKQNLGTVDVVTSIGEDDHILIETGGSIRRVSASAITVPYVENDVAYGIRRSVSNSSPTCERIGNMDLHRTLPVQSMMRGCLLDDDGNVTQWLPDSSWEGATLDGSKGQVMVRLPLHYRKCQLLDDGTMEVWLSLYHLPDYEEIPEMYVSAYEATVQRSTNKLSSVMSDDPDYRGGNNNADWDEYYYSQLGTPATNISSNNSRTYARNRGEAGLNGCGWNSYLYEAHKALTWLFVVEYATLNSQAAYNEELTEEGYRQGGLSAGITNLSGTRWQNWHNGRYDSVVKCGVTNSFGNRTGVLPMTMPFEYDGSTTTSGDYGTHYVGEYDASTAYTSGEYVSDGDLLYQCVADAPAGTSLSNTTYFSSVTRTTTNVPRYRGVENIFGNLGKWVCDLLVMAHASEESGGEGDGLNYYYVCKDPSKFSGTSVDDYTFLGTCPGSPTGGAWKYFTEIVFGPDGEILGTNEGGSPSAYFCDGHYVNNNITADTLRGVFVGGHASIGSNAGLFCAHSHGAPSDTSSSLGSRLCFLPAA